MSYQRHVGGKQIAIASRLAAKSLIFTGCSEFIASMGRPWGSEWRAIPNFVDTNFYTFNPLVADDAPLVFLSRIEQIKGAHTAIAVALKSGRHLILAGNRVNEEEATAYWKKEIEHHLNKNGIEYVADWVIDDLPQDIVTPHGTITTIPYSVETNDIVIHALQHLSSEQFLKRCTDQFDRLYLEGAANTRIMAISIHPYITGVPHRIKYLEALLDYVIGHDGVALMTASEIGDWYRAEMAK